MFGEIQNFDRMQRLVWRPVVVNRTTGRANDRTIAEILVGSCISRRRSCNQSAQVVHRCMFSHSEVLRDVARPIVRGYNQLHDQKHDN